MNPNINYYGIVILLRKLRECGIFTEKELRKIAARIAADNGAFCGAQRQLVRWPTAAERR